MIKQSLVKRDNHTSYKAGLYIQVNGEEAIVTDMANRSGQTAQNISENVKCIERMVKENSFI